MRYIVKKNVPTTFNFIERGTLNGFYEKQYPNSLCLLDNGNTLMGYPISEIPERLQLSSNYSSYITMERNLTDSWDPENPSFFVGQYVSEGVKLTDTIDVPTAQGYHLNYFSFFYSISVKSQYSTNDVNYMINTPVDEIISIFGSEISGIQSNLLDNEHYFIYLQNSLMINGRSNSWPGSSALGTIYNLVALSFRLKDSYVPVAGDYVKFHFKSELLGLDHDYSFTFQNE